jgi:hypothetical protein
VSSYAACTPWIFLIAAIFWCGGVAATESNEISEFELPQKGSAAVVLAHFYPEGNGPGPAPAFSIESQINGIRRKREVALQLSGPGERPSYGFNHTIDILSREYIEATVFTGSRIVRQRLRNVFYDPSHRTVALVANSESLPKNIGSGKGTIVYLFAGPFRKGMAKAQRVRALRNYQQTNYVLFRFL